MQLRSLLTDILPNLSDHPALLSTVRGLSTDSRHCQPGDLFVGMPGTQVDGGLFWSKALESGAIAALISPLAFEQTATERTD